MQNPDYRFIPGVQAPAVLERAAYWFPFQENQMVVRRNGEALSVLEATDLAEAGLTAFRRHYLGRLAGVDGETIHCFSAEISPSAPLPEGLVAEGLRTLFTQWDGQLAQLAGRAVQVVDWDRTHLYCGRCAAPMQTVSFERAKKCANCGLTNYPRLSPAIIIAVVRQTPEGPRLLLARSHRFPTQMYSVVAGFVEPGETLEECAQREVLEEVGIRIQNVRYVASQPWPFPNSLMLGFTAEYAGGDFVLEEAEIADAQWFAPDALPMIPPKISIARRLIDWFVAEYGDWGQGSAPMVG